MAQSIHLNGGWKTQMRFGIAHTSIVLVAFSGALSGCSLLTSFTDYSFSQSDADFFDGDVDAGGDSTPEADTEVADEPDEFDGDHESEPWVVQSTLRIVGCNAKTEPGCVCAHSGPENAEVCAIYPRGWHERGLVPGIGIEFIVEYSFESSGEGVEAVSYFLGEQEIAIDAYDELPDSDSNSRWFEITSDMVGIRGLGIEIRSASGQTERFYQEVQLTEGLPCGEPGFHTTEGPVHSFGVEDWSSPSPRASAYGEDIGVVWLEGPDDYRSLRMAAIHSEEEFSLSDPIEINAFSIPSIAAFEGGYAVAWSSRTWRDGGQISEHKLFLFDGALTLSSSEPLKIAQYGRGYPHISVTLGHDELGVLFTGDNSLELQFVRISLTGEILSPEEQLGVPVASETDSRIWHSRIIWDPDGERYWIVWSTLERTSVAFFSPDDPTNSIQATLAEHESEQETFPEIVWSGEELGVAYWNGLHGSPLILFNSVKETEGVLVVGESVTALLLNDDSYRNTPRLSIAWSGSEYLIVDGREQFAIGVLGLGGESLGVEQLDFSASGYRLQHPWLIWHDYSYQAFWYQIEIGAGNRQIVYQPFEVCR